MLLEKAMAPHSSTLAWKIPRTEEPGGLQSMGSRSIRHDWATSLSLFTFLHWRRKWQPTAVFLPGEPQGQGSLVGCCLWGHRACHLAVAAACSYLLLGDKGWQGVGDPTPSIPSLVLIYARKVSALAGNLRLTVLGPKMFLSPWQKAGGSAVFKPTR